MTNTPTSSPTPPPYYGSDENRKLLEAISNNPETAHILAAVAEGGNPEELLRELLKPSQNIENPEVNEETPEAPAAEEKPETPSRQEPAMFQPDLDIPDEDPRRPYPNFLSHLSGSFWGERF